jgi:hypothetical protein
MREEYCWLVVGGWFVVREKYCWLVADKPSEQMQKTVVTIRSQAKTNQVYQSAGQFVHIS